jgi:hypothetical protein
VGSITVNRASGLSAVRMATAASRVGEALEVMIAAD